MVELNYKKLSDDLKQSITYDNKIKDISEKTGVCTAVLYNIIHCKERKGYTFTVIMSIINYLGGNAKDYIK